MAPTNTGRSSATAAASAYEGPDTAEAARERERVHLGEIPSRYGEPWGRPFFEAARPALNEGASILDVGSGRRPTLPPSERPRSSTYVGLDISADELSAAPPGAYDEAVTGDISSPPSGLANRFDLVLSWQVLEHVRSMPDALRGMRACLRPGGRMVAQLSGSRAAFALLARITPYAISTRAMEKLMGAEPEEKFPTHYDRCRASQLRPLLEEWTEHGVIPRFKGGAYFRFARPIERAYLAYEDWAARSRRPDLATHYVIWAVN